MQRSYGPPRSDRDARDGRGVTRGAAFVDCADTCGTSGLCPDGLSCDTATGYCRTPGATGTCELDNPDTCPPIPMAQGCMSIGPAPEMPFCHVTCAGKTGTEAIAFRVGTWHAAAIADATELAAVMASTSGQPAWIGLRQPPGQPSTMAGWAWMTMMPFTFMAWAASQPDDGDTTENGTEQCAVLTGDTWADEACTASHPFVIEP